MRFTPCLNESNVTVPSGVPKKQPTIFMLDLLATVPYYTAYLSRALLAEGAAVTVGSITYYLDHDCFTTRNIHVDPGCLNMVGKYSLPRALRRVLKLTEAILNMGALAVRFAFAPPAVIHVQYLPMLHWYLPLDSWFLSFCCRLGSKTVLTVHDLPPHDAADRYRQIHSRLYHKVDKIICHSEHVRKRLFLEFGIGEENISIIPHGPFFYDLPDKHAEDTRRTMQAAPGEMIVLWQGIIFPYKGLDTLLDAWAHVEADIPDARLVVVGTGAPALLDQIRSQAQTLGLKRVTFIFRFASTQELVAVYRSADIVVYPYREITTSGALATGLALGKAIVASDLPVFRELLTNGEDALLVEPNSPRQLGNAITRLLQNGELRKKFIVEVTARSFGAQSWVSIATQTMHVYDSALANAPHTSK